MFEASLLAVVCAGVRVGGSAGSEPACLGVLLAVRFRKAVRMCEAEARRFGVRGGASPGDGGIRKAPMLECS